jgi:hypothetical protein
MKAKKVMARMTPRVAPKAISRAWNISNLHFLIAG